MKTIAVKFCAIIFCAAILISCTKITDTISNNNNTTDECNKLKSVKAHPVAAVNPGATITLTADDCDGLYEWNGPDNFQSYDQTNTISDITFSNAGWYYLSVTNPDCTPKYDSVYVTVNFPQGTPSCSLTNNVMSFNSLPDQDFTSGVYFDASNGYSLEGNSDAGDVTVIFSSYWFTHEPLDGVYTTTSDQLFDASNIDQIFISDVNSDIYFVGEPGKPVYVSHVNGKLSVSFCSINFTGDNGQDVFHSLASAQLTER